MPPARWRVGCPLRFSVVDFAGLETVRQILHVVVVEDLSLGMEYVRRESVRSWALGVRGERALSGLAPYMGHSTTEGIIRYVKRGQRASGCPPREHPRFPMSVQLLHSRTSSDAMLWCKAEVQGGPSPFWLRPFGAAYGPPRLPFVCALAAIHASGVGSSIVRLLVQICRDDVC